MPIRAVNETLGRHMAVWFYSTLDEDVNMPNFDLDTLMNTNSVGKVQKEWDINALPDWLKDYTETRDKKTAEYDTGREAKVYLSDVLAIYNRTKRELLAMEKIEELGITYEELGFEKQGQLNAYLHGIFVLDEVRLNSLLMASELDTKEDFLYMYGKMYDIQKSPRMGTFHKVPSIWQKSISLQEWKEGRLDKVLGITREEQPKSEHKSEPKSEPEKESTKKRIVSATLPSGLKESVVEDSRVRGLSISSIVESLIRRRMN